MTAERLLLQLTRVGTRLRPHAAVSAERPASVASEFDQAMTWYEKQQFALAYAAMAGLADDGHPEAARIALLMRAHGTRLFGGSYPASAERRARWLACATLFESKRAQQAVQPW